MTPRIVRHATAWLPARQQIVAFIIHCKLTSFSESTHKYLFTCPNSEKYKVPDGVRIRRSTVTCVTRCLMPLPMGGSGPVAMTTRFHKAR